MRRIISDFNGFRHYARDCIGSDTDDWTETQLEQLIENLAIGFYQIYRNQDFRYGDDINEYEGMTEREFEELIEGLSK